MKIKYPYLLILSLPVLMMCRHSPENKNIEKLAQSRPGWDCFMAIDGKDSAFLKISTSGKNGVSGHLSILYSNHKKNEGRFTGSYQGDTLFVTYRFRSGEPGNAVFTNPLALLKKGDSLVLGTGKIMKNLGRVYLDKKQGIDFKRGRFRFYSVSCNENLGNLSKR
ncbi:hypothetical protein ACFE6N_19000 [Pedobacter sp. BG31]|uniref:hypothetical protein n=1 Tax=Pedobacter sp. BG31 TaxID=3349697 RepID=UPI0035F28717